MTYLLFVFWLILVSYILFETEAFIEYMRLLRIKFFKYKEFDRKQEIFGNISYPAFIRGEYPNFWGKMLTCKECVIIWANIVFFAVVGGWGYFGAVAVFSLIGSAFLKWILNKFYN